MSTADIIEAIGKNDEAQKFKIGQPIFENLSERDNHYFLKGSARGADKMKAAILIKVKALLDPDHCTESVTAEDIFKVIENAEVNDVAE